MNDLVIPLMSLLGFVVGSLCVSFAIWVSRR